MSLVQFLLVEFVVCFAIGGVFGWVMVKIAMKALTKRLGR